jgi:hypothetical protein
LERIVDRCAGLDVHKASITACVRISTTSKDEEPHQEIRKFETTTRGLLQLRDWLASFEVELVGMEATGVYWKPVFYYVLEDDFECWLLNARHLKNVYPEGRPTPRMPSGSASWWSTVLSGRASCHPRRSASLGTLLATVRRRSRSVQGRCSAWREGLARRGHQALFGSNARARSFGTGDARCFG